MDTPAFIYIQLIFHFMVASAIGFAIWQDFTSQRVNLLTGIISGYLWFSTTPLVVLMVTGSVENELIPLSGIPDVTFSNAFKPILIINMTGFLLLIAHQIQELFHRSWMTLFPPRPIDESRCIGVKSLCEITLAYVCIVCFYLYTTGILDGGHWAESSNEALQRNDYNPFMVVMNAMHTIFKFIVPMMFIVAYKNRQIAFSTMSVALLMAAAVDLFFTGNRIATAMSLVIYFIVLLQEGKKVVLASLILLFPVIIFLGNAFKHARGDFHENGISIESIMGSFDKAIVSADHDTKTLILNACEGVDLNVFTAVVQDFPSRYDFTYGESVFRVFHFFVPRTLWPEKPPPLSWRLGELYGQRGLSLNTTIIGESYICFGYFGPLFLAILLLLANSLSRYVPLSANQSGYLFFFIGLGGYRFDLFFICTSVPIIWILMHLRYRSFSSAQIGGAQPVLEQEPPGRR